VAYQLIDGPRRWIAAARARLEARDFLSSWGITSRLMLAFVGVVVLAAAANLIVERGVSIATRAPAAPAQSSIEAVVPLRIVALPEYETISADELTRALERFDQSTSAAVESGSAEVQAQYRQAGKDLERAATAFLTHAAQVANRSFPLLRPKLQEHQRTAARWIELSRLRHKLLRGYSETLGEMNARVNASLDRSFKILGRVVARQSLVQVDANLDQVRERFAAAVRSGNPALDTFNDIRAAELALAKTLALSARGLKRAEGEEWFAAMEADVDALNQLRTSLETTHREFAEAAHTFVNQASALIALLPKDIQVLNASSTAPTLENAANETMVVASQPTLPVPTAPEVAHPANPAMDQSGIENRRAIVAGTTVVVLLMLILISFATVRSVARPVDDMIAASRKIAAGEPNTRVRRGGIKELDTLAVAFNDMADRLARAQALALDAHQQLEQKVVERTRQLQELAELDPLTGLPNRRHLFTLLNTCIEKADHEHCRVGVLFLDVDNFKNINDSVGHSFGDRVLRGIAQRLESATHSLGFAARLGGDEFTVVCDKAASIEDVQALGETIIRAFQSPIDVDGRELIVGMSVGASVYPDHERSAEALLIAADTALFNAKALGRSRLSMFTPELLAGASTKFRIEQDLRRAIEREEFELFFQPELGVDNFQTHLAEALIRWRKADGTYIPPGEFLSVAEESGLIIEISDWVLRTAIKAAAMWHRGSWPQARVAINVSPRQLLDYRFVDRVQQLLKEHDVPPRCIEIELTESVLQTGPATIEQLHRLRGLGLAIALDDFGTGYSSLSSLEQLPLTRVKLDRSLIESIDSNERSRSIVRAIIDLCNGLDLQVTAEGLERPEQFERFMGCKNLSLQGYLLARPVPMGQLLAEMKHAAARAQELVLLSKPKHAQVAAVKTATTIDRAANV
jgi:diguanylate cyclase (GGDEF)-like protein